MFDVVIVVSLLDEYLPWSETWHFLLSTAMIFAAAAACRQTLSRAQEEDN